MPNAPRNGQPCQALPGGDPSLAAGLRRECAVASCSVAKRNWWRPSWCRQFSPLVTSSPDVLILRLVEQAG